MREYWRIRIQRAGHRLRQDVSLKDLLRRLREMDPVEEVQAYLRTHPSLMGVLYWASATVAAVLSVLYASAFHELSTTAQLLALRDPYVFMGVAPLAFLLSWWLVQRFSPNAGGSGIPQVMAAIEVDSEEPDQRVNALVGPRVAIVKVLSSLALVAGGGAVGREGPTIQIAASIFLFIGNRFRRIWPQINHQALLIAGGAAGLAAAFNTPLGGIVFAIEELSHHHFNRFKTFLISAVIVSGMAAQWMLGPYLYFGYPTLEPWTMDFLPWAILIGAVTGLGGGAFGRLLGRLTEWADHWTIHRKILYLLFVGLLMAVSGAFVEPRIMGGGSEVIRGLLFESSGEVGWELVAGRFLAPLLCFSIGGAGGIFAPSLAAGAVIGAKLSQVLPSSGHPNLMILLGMAGFLAAVTRAPFTSFVLVLEMTDRHSAIFPMMVAAMVAVIAARVVDHQSYYAIKRERLLRKESETDGKNDVMKDGKAATSPENPTDK